MKYWERVLEKFFSKYKGLAEWHNKIVQEVTQTGRYVNPATKRVHTFKRTPRGDWPVTTIKNYPVQALGADIMSIARVSFYKRFKDEGIDGVLVNTVHDSIVVDCHEKERDRVARLFHGVFDDLPANFERLFGVRFNLPLKCEVSYGSNMKELTEI